MSDRAAFLEGNLFRHISVMSFTASIGLMAIFLVDFVDMIFISMLGKAELAAAIGYAGAILFFTASFGIGMSIAAGAQIGRAIGSGDEDRAQRLATTSLIYAILFSAVFAAIIWANLSPLLALLGAAGETHSLAMTYASILIPSLPLLVVGMVGSAILRAHGAARKSMMVTIVGGLVNAILDPILIFGLDLELTGAALASVAARFAIAAAAFGYVLRDHGGLARPNVRDLRNHIGPILAIAVPAILTQFATPVGTAYVTRAMAEFGEAAVAGMAIVGRLTPVAFATIFALSGAIGPILAQNYGAGDLGRVRRGFADGLLFTALVCVFVAIVLFALRWPIAALFEADGVARQLVFLFCGPLALLYFFNGAMFVANAAFNNLGHPFYSTWLNWGRHTLGTIPFVMLGGFWLGAPGVLIGQAVGGVVFGLVAIWLGLRVIAAPKPDAKPAAHGAFRPRLLQLLHLRH